MNGNEEKAAVIAHKIGVLINNSGEKLRVFL